MPAHLQGHIDGVFRPRLLPSRSAGGIVIPGPTGNGILTEGGDFLITEDGDYLVTESTVLGDAILALSPFVYYKLNESAGATSVNDFSGNSRHLDTVTGTLGATALISEGGYAIDVAPSTHATSGDDIYGADITTAFAGNNQPLSVFAIVYPDTIPLSGEYIVHFGRASQPDAQGFALAVASDGRIVWQAFNGSWVVLYSNTVGEVTTGATISIGATRDSSGNITMYKNGVSVGTGACTGAISLLTGSAYRKITIGAHWGGAGGNVPAYGWDGRIQHVAVFNSNIGSAGMTALHTATGL